MLSLKQKLTLGIGALPIGVIMALNMSPIPMTIAKNLTSNVALVTGLVIGAYWLLSILLSPVIGAMSDRTKTKIGRRLPYLRIFVPMSAAGIFGMAVFAGTSNSMLSLALFIASYLVVAFSYSVWAGPYWALMPDITEESERGETSGYMQGLNILGVVLAMMVSAALWDKSPTITLCIFGAVALVTGLVTAFGIKEKENYPVEEKAKLSDIVKDLFAANELAKFFCISMLWWFAMGSIQSFFVLYAEKSLNAKVETSNIIMGIFTIILVVCAVPFGIFADKLGKRKILLAGILMAGLGMIQGFFITNIAYAYVTMGITAAGLGAIIVLTYTITADLIPKGKEGKFMGLSNFFMAVPNAIAASGMGALITAFGEDYRIIWIVGSAAMFAAFFLMRFVKTENK
ncbi:MAG: MFS transporter [Candidatus Thermoplasmatota archaeon]|nr:MFS transporter [Candidatus Thermoplasmatota archaeon]